MTDAEFRRRVLAVVADRDEAAEQGCRERGKIIARIGAEVAVFTTANPDATANDVARSVRGRREDVLRAVRELRAAQRRYQSGRNHVDEIAPDVDAVDARHAARDGEGRPG